MRHVLREQALSDVRAGEPADAPRLSDIARAAYGVYVAEIGQDPPPMHQDFSADIAAGAVWVIGRPAYAYVVARFDGDAWLIENVAVDPALQGMGLGRRLIAAAEAEGTARGHARAVLYTNAAMRANLALYPRLGYRETARRVEQGLSRVFFEKALREQARDTAAIGPPEDRPVKRSLTLQGHRTSVSLEAAFWEAFRAIAARRGLSVNALAAEVDAVRTPPASLASAIRLFVLRDLQAQAGEGQPG